MKSQRSLGVFARSYTVWNMSGAGGGDTGAVLAQWGAVALRRTAAVVRGATKYKRHEDSGGRQRGSDCGSTTDMLLDEKQRLKNSSVFRKLAIG